MTLRLHLIQLSMLLAAVVLFAACGASADKKKLGPKPISCTPGATAVCPCIDGSMSMQVCTVYGRYDTCKCALQPLGSAGTGAGTGQ